MNTAISIAIADDHKSMLQGIKEILLAMGFTVPIEACNGRDLLNCIESATSTPDMCLIDLNMPVMDGFAAIAELRRRKILVKIIAYSMNDDALYVAEAMRAGADRFFAKGDDSDELRRLIRDCVASST